MYWISTSCGKVISLIIFSMVVAAIIVASFSTNKQNGSFFHLSKPMSDGTVVFLTIVLGIVLACGIDADYAALNPHHLHYSDKINYFDPYDGWHYWPSDDQFCTPEGDRISLDAAWDLYEDSHDVVRDLEGNVTAVYPKGEAPVSELTDRDRDCPYYLDNMTEEQEEVYIEAKSIVEYENISKSALYDWLTAEYPYDYDPEVVSFALEALEENQIVNWQEECLDSYDDYVSYKMDYTREDIYDHLVSEGFTSVEADEVIALYNE